MDGRFDSFGAIIAQLLRRAAAAIERDPTIMERLAERADAALREIEAAPGPLQEASSSTASDPSSPPASGDARRPTPSVTPEVERPAPPALVEPRPPAPADAVLAADELMQRLRMGDNSPTRAPRTIDPSGGPPQQKIHHIAAEWHNLLSSARDIELTLMGVRRAARFGRAASGGDLISLLNALQAHDPALHPRVQRATARLGKARIHAWPAYLAHEPPAGLLVNAERAYAAMRLSMLLVYEDLDSIVKSGRPLHGLVGSSRMRLEHAAQLVAESQCMVKTAAAMLQTRGGAVPADLTGHCDVQLRVFEGLREIIVRDNAGLFLREHMTAREARSPEDAGQLLHRVHKLNDERRRSDGLASPSTGLDTDDDTLETDTDAEAGPHFETILDAVMEAERLFGAASDAPLLFLDSVYESAANSPYKRPGEVFRLLTALAESAQEWRGANGNLGRSFAGLLGERGFGEKIISQTTEAKFGGDYTFPYGGRPVLFEHHWTLGSRSANTCLSVHWHRDTDAKRIVIGHCGRHLRNTRT